jgi:Fic family protein
VAERLRGWLDAVERGASQGLILIKRCREWEGRAIRRIGDLKGKGAPRLVAVLACRPLVSAKAASRMLGISQTQARALLNEFENRGLIRERTGHRRFRFWEARL